ncbi:energy transducer TonB [Yoonia sp.]|uniref:energy transducer TonB n=1 Tax=Yoonia sp. TaxID=2212373 RepID=UPI00397626EA
MATPGTIISGVGHVGLIGWLIVGWGLSSEPLAIQTMDVSVISGEEFEQMRARTTPEPGNADPTAPVPPVISDSAPPPPAQEEPTEPSPRPEPVEPPQSEVPPPPHPPAPPETEVTDAPPAEPAPPVATPPTPDVEVSETPTPPQAPTVASTITAPPPPDANVDDVVREEVVPDDSAEAEVVAEEQEATAPEETTTAIVIEDLAPTTSVRPSARPSRPTPPQDTQAAQEEPVTTAPEVSEEAVASALEAALDAATQAPVVAAGPPLDSVERDGFRLSVQRCWNVGGMSSAAQRVKLTVAFELDRNKKIIGNNIELIGSEGGDQSAVDVAFRTARSAIFQCQNRDGGFDLPDAKYDSWREVELTFDPSEMRLR